MPNFVNTVDLIGDDALTDSIIDRSITEYADNNITSIGNYAFCGCSSLVSIDFPLVASLDDNAFLSCSALTTANFPAVTSIGNYAFNSCSHLTTLILRNTNTVCALGAMVLASTPIASGTGYIYVPAALVDSYKANSNWSAYANQFRALENYTVDGTTTGALDDSKVNA